MTRHLSDFILLTLILKMTGSLAVLHEQAASEKAFAWGAVGRTPENSYSYGS